MENAVTNLSNLKRYNFIIEVVIIFKLSLVTWDLLKKLFILIDILIVKFGGF